MLQKQEFINLRFLLIYFFNKIRVDIFYLNIYYYSRKTLVSIYLYFNSKLKKDFSIVFLKMKVLQVYLQQYIQRFFKKKLRFFLKNVLLQLKAGHNFQLAKISKYLITTNTKSKENFKDLTNIFYLSLLFKNPSVLVKKIAYYFYFIRNHKKLIHFVKKGLKILMSSFIKLKSFKLIVSGKVNGVSRTKTVVINSDKPFVTLEKFKEYVAFYPAVTYTGVFGLKLFFKYK